MAWVYTDNPKLLACWVRVPSYRKPKSLDGRRRRSSSQRPSEICGSEVAMDKNVYGIRGIFSTRCYLAGRLASIIFGYAHLVGALGLLC